MNISLFHYRNHGTDYGRALVGLNKPAGEKRTLHALLDQRGYRYWDESDNPAYPLFLRQAAWQSCLSAGIIQVPANHANCRE